MRAATASLIGSVTENFLKDVYVDLAFNLPGNWSSYPPHKHDVDNIPYENKLEEVYHFRIEPPQGFGTQRIYTQDVLA